MKKTKLYCQLMCAVALLALSSCFTGVENTPKITEKDVSRTMTELERRQPTLSLTAYQDSLPNWRAGKQFFVTDDQARLLFAHNQSVDLDSVKFAGRFITFAGTETVNGLDNRDVVDILMSIDGNTFTYHTGKSMGDFTSSFTIPLLIDMDMVNHVAAQIQGKDVYIKTPIWYDIDKEYMMRGRQFIKVHIDQVLPGNKVLPLKVVFSASDNGQQAFVWMSSTRQSINNRDYDSMFTSRDVHENYPDIPVEHWELIINGDVAIDMTKEECRLSMGAPKQVSRMPNQAEVREFWYYDGGSYLQFVDGLLKAYRK